MQLTKIVSATMIVGALGLGAFGPGGAVASASPVANAPLKPHDDFCAPWCDGPGRGHGGDRDAGNRHWDGDKGPWWANNRHDWWDDRRGAPPWGWGPPPAYQWMGGPPRPFNYWGYDVNPVWDDGFRGWGVWVLGQWVPIIGITGR